MNGTMACASCGAPISQDARHCDYCHAPVASVRCANCFHLSSPNAAHCAGCGRELGLEPIPGETTLSCVDCARPLDVFANGPGHLYDCAKCGGQFVEHALLRDLLERREVCGAAVPRRAMSQNSASRPVRYVPCPACHVLMNRQNFGGSSGVIVDVCARHGVWFHEGELSRVLEFVESGGLARARRREIEEAESARKALHAAAVDAVSDLHTTEGQLHLPPLSGGSLTYSFVPAWKTRFIDDAREVATAILHELGDRIGKR